MIVTLTGASGVGKSTIGKWLRTFLVCFLKPIQSLTTREPRESDPFDEYTYVSSEEFEKMKIEGKFIWEVCPHGTYYYGTTLESLQEARQNPDKVFLMILEPRSVKTLLLYAKENNLEVFPVFVASPTKTELRRRLKNRLRKEIEKEVINMVLQRVPGLIIQKYVKQKKEEGRIAIEKRISDCEEWDEQALSSEIPYFFVLNEFPDDGRTTATVLANEIYKILGS